MQVLDNNSSTALAADLLLQWPTLESLQKQSAHKVRKFFYGHNCRNKQKLLERLELIKTAKPLTRARIAPIQQPGLRSEQFVECAVGFVRRGLTRPDDGTSDSKMLGHEIRFALAEVELLAPLLARRHRFEHHRGQVGVPPLVERRVVPQLVNVLVGSDVEDLLLRTERGEPRGEPRERRSATNGFYGPVFNAFARPVLHRQVVRVGPPTRTLN